MTPKEAIKVLDYVSATVLLNKHDRVVVDTALITIDNLIKEQEKLSSQ